MIVNIEFINPLTRVINRIDSNVAKPGLSITYIKPPIIVPIYTIIPDLINILKLNLLDSLISM